MYVHLMPHPGFGWLLSQQKYLYLFIEDNKINQSPCNHNPLFIQMFLVKKCIGLCHKKSSRGVKTILFFKYRFIVVKKST